jgi:hypothetical protein
LAPGPAATVASVDGSGGGRETEGGGGGRREIFPPAAPWGAPQEGLGVVEQPKFNIIKKNSQVVRFYCTGANPLRSSRPRELGADDDMQLKHERQTRQRHRVGEQHCFLVAGSR